MHISGECVYVYRFVSRPNSLIGNHGTMIYDKNRYAHSINFKLMIFICVYMFSYTVNETDNFPIVAQYLICLA